MEIKDKSELAYSPLKIWLQITSVHSLIDLKKLPRFKKHLQTVFQKNI